MLNRKIPISGNIEVPEVISQKPLYVIFVGPRPGIFLSYEEIMIQKIEIETEGGLIFKNYANIDETLDIARKVMGPNYYIDPIAKEYIQMSKRTNKNIPVALSSNNIKEETSSS